MKAQYRFDGKDYSVGEFANDSAAFDYAVGCYDDRSAYVEKLINGVWHYWDYKADEFLGNGWVNPATPMTVSVEWSYPTSPNADKVGKKDGCWSVSVSSNLYPPVQIAGYTLRSVAMLHAVKLNIPWNKCWLACNAADLQKDWFAESRNEVKNYTGNRPAVVGELAELPTA